MVCPNCNKNISDNVIHCPLCGGVTGSIPKPPEPCRATDVHQADYNTPSNNYTYLNGQSYLVEQQKISNGISVGDFFDFYIIYIL